MSDLPFQPVATGTAVSATVASSSQALGVQGRSQTVRIAAPAGGAIAFINFGASTVTAAATDTPILPGTVEVFSVGSAVTHIAAITASSTQTIYHTCGDGA